MGSGVLMGRRFKIGPSVSTKTCTLGKGRPPYPIQVGAFSGNGRGYVSLPECCYLAR